MQKIELTNDQYRILMQLVCLGVEVVENAGLEDFEDEKDNEEGAQLLEDVFDLEGYLMGYYKKFGVKDVVRTNLLEETFEYQEEFEDDCQYIAHEAYTNKLAEIASFQLGIRDYKEEHGENALDNLSPEQGVEKLVGYSTKYLEEIVENGFRNFYLRKGNQSKLISIS